MTNYPLLQLSDLYSEVKQNPIATEVDVAVIGNGPSSLFLSLLLSGYRPYFRGQHPDPFLTARLSEHPNTSILDQDLQYLSDGLEGRSTNQAAILLDSLLHPNADIGETHPSSLYWQHDPSKAISHVVIGSGQPGGSWHQIKGHIKTLSLGSWLELPMYTFQQWKDDNVMRVTDEGGWDSLKRVTFGSVAQYYTDYVSRMGLEKNMISGVHVTKVMQVNCSSRVMCTLGSPSPFHSPDPGSFHHQVSCFIPTKGTSPPNSDFSMRSVDSGLCLNSEDKCRTAKTYFSRDSSPDDSCFSDSDDAGVYCDASRFGGYNWCLRGSGCNSHTKDILVRSKNLVLACGVGENAKKLRVSGEDASFVCHRFADFCQRLDGIRPEMDQNAILIVGAGLSAADALLVALEKGLSVVHVFRKDPRHPSLIYHNMPKALYPEYAQIFSLMKGEEVMDNYTPVSCSRVDKFEDGGGCMVENKVGVKTRYLVSVVGVFIGSEAKLDFLPDSVTAKLPVIPDLPIDPKTNPVSVDPFTFECESSSLYAMGPLVGDNFVRFVLGSGLGVCKHLTEKLLSLNSDLKP